MIVANFLINTVTALLNTTPPGATTPSFAAGRSFAVGANPYSVTTADLNDDGKPDLIVTNFSADSTVSVLLNTIKGCGYGQLRLPAAIRQRRRRECGGGRR